MEQANDKAERQAGYYNVLHKTEWTLAYYHGDTYRQWSLFGDSGVYVDEDFLSIDQFPLTSLSELQPELQPVNKTDLVSKEEMVKFAIWYRVVGYKGLWEINGDYDKLYEQFLTRNAETK